MTTQCADCGYQNDDRARFCESCGVSLHERCPSCNAAVRGNQKFCRQCGSTLVGASGNVTRRPTPRHIAEQIMGAISSLEGERKIVTLLFADVANSTALIRDLDAEEANRILEPTLERMMKAVDRYEGTITQTAGDGVMAIFGAPIAHEDHAVRACYAALDMQEAMRGFATEVRREYGLLLQVRIGINSGPVVAGVIGKNKFIYDVWGDTVNTASRMESHGTEGSIHVTEETYRRVEADFAFEPRGEIEIKGKGKMRTYFLLGPKA